MPVLPAWWVVGFIDAELCFHVGIAVSSSMSLDYQVSLEFSITQHERDLALLDKFIVFLGVDILQINLLHKFLSTESEIVLN